METFAQCPIATSFNRNQPRLLLVSVDVQEGAVVTFDSYPKDEQGTRRETQNMVNSCSQRIMIQRTGIINIR